MHEYTMREYAANMGVKLSDDTIKSQAQRVVRKIATTQDFEDEVRRTAISSYPAYEDQINAGMTIKDIASPYMDMMSSELELPEANVTLDDPVVKRALNGLDADGKPGGVPLYQFQAQLRNDPRWTKTQAAQNNMMNVSRQVLRDLGLIGD